MRRPKGNGDEDPAYLDVPEIDEPNMWPWLGWIERACYGEFRDVCVLQPSGNVGKIHPENGGNLIEILALASLDIPFGGILLDMRNRREESETIH
jgi:hypothetical protein